MAAITEHGGRIWTDSEGDALEVSPSTVDGQVALIEAGVSTGAYLSANDAREVAAFLLSLVPAEDTIDPGTDWGITPQALTEAMAGIDPDRSTVAMEAQSLVYGDRNDGYGHPRHSHTRISQLWTALLSDKLTDGEYVTPEDVARCMVALKLARDVNTPKRDNRVDGIGYLIALDRMETGL